MMVPPASSAAAFFEDVSEVVAGFVGDWGGENVVGVVVLGGWSGISVVGTVGSVVVFLGRVVSLVRGGAVEA